LGGVLCRYASTPLAATYCSSVDHQLAHGPCSRLAAGSALIGEHRISGEKKYYLAIVAAPRSCSACNTRRCITPVPRVPSLIARSPRTDPAPARCSEPCAGCSCARAKPAASACRAPHWPGHCCFMARMTGAVGRMGAVYFAVIALVACCCWGCRRDESKGGLRSSCHCHHKHFRSASGSSGARGVSHERHRVVDTSGVECVDDLRGYSAGEGYQEAGRAR
jgi:hypothetical protein